jgi:hypothetical protein
VRRGELHGVSARLQLLNPPPVSIVMPTRNQAGFIAAAVGSVFSQGVAGTELRVQDGASSDGTQDLLGGLANQHGGLAWRSEADDGPAEAVNRAVARVRAPFVGWLNSDDQYTPGAIGRALDHFRAHPDHVMVYGEGEHIDTAGRPLGRYPSLPPSAPLSAWRDGCPICQPTAFFRRDAFMALGGLDTRLRTAFDYDFWLRMFKAYPGRIGYLPHVQALSRLHDQGITMRLREQVALEGMAVVHRHLGAAPAHWLVTYAAEALAACPFEAETPAVKQHLLALADGAAPWLAPGGVDELKQEMQSSPAWRLAQPHFAAAVHADGWAGPVLTVRLQQPEAPRPPVQVLRLHGRHAWPRPGHWRLRLSVWCDGRQVATATAWWRRGFALDIPVPTQRAGARTVLQVRASDSFVPATVVPGSRDQRPLSFLLDRIEALPAGALPLGYDP